MTTSLSPVIHHFMIGDEIIVEFQGESHSKINTLQYSLPIEWCSQSKILLICQIKLNYLCKQLKIGCFLHNILLLLPLVCQTAQFNVEHFSGMHNWYACSHARPTFCNVCKDSLSGVTSHGLSCEGKRRTINRKAAVSSALIFCIPESRSRWLIVCLCHSILLILHVEVLSNSDRTKCNKGKRGETFVHISPKSSTSS